MKLMLTELQSKKQIEESLQRLEKGEPNQFKW